jgi:hypothetical protein
MTGRRLWRWPGEACRRYKKEGEISPCFCRTEERERKEGWRKGIGFGECERDSEWRENKEERGAGEREVERKF